MTECIIFFLQGSSFLTEVCLWQISCYCFEKNIFSKYCSSFCILTNFRGLLKDKCVIFSIIWFGIVQDDFWRWHKWNLDNRQKREKKNIRARLLLYKYDSPQIKKIEVMRIYIEICHQILDHFHRFADQLSIYLSQTILQSSKNKINIDLRLILTTNHLLKRRHISSL